MNILGVFANKFFQMILLVIAGVLVYSLAQIFLEDNDEEDMKNDLIVKFFKRIINRTNKFDGNKFFIIV